LEKNDLDKRFDERDRREAQDSLRREQRTRGAVYAPGAFSALCADLKHIVADYKKRAHDSTVTVGENHGFLTIHRSPFPALHMEVHPPCPKPPSNLIEIKGWLRTHRTGDQEDLSGVVEVLPNDGRPGESVLYYGDGLETADASIPAQILGRILDVLMQ
jgi:hypothetical protein